MPTTLPRAFCFLLGLWIALALLGPIGEARPAPLAAALHAELEAEMVTAVNRVRGERHRQPLRRDADLDRVARAHSLDMARRGFFAHVNPEGVDPVGRLRAGFVDGFSLAAENVGQTNRGAPNDEILRGWILSPVHRENLMAPAFNATGLGIARAENGTWFYTQVYVTYPR